MLNSKMEKKLGDKQITVCNDMAYTHSDKINNLHFTIMAGLYTHNEKI